MNNMNKWVLLAVAAVIIVAGIVVFARPNKQAAVPTSNTDTEQQAEFDPKNPGFTLGTVTRVQPEQLELKIGPTAAIVKLTASTKLAKQIRDKETKLISAVDASIADIKVGSQVVIYFSTPPQDNVYVADKIQIISQ